MILLKLLLNSFFFNLLKKFLLQLYLICLESDILCMIELLLLIGFRRYLNIFYMPIYNSLINENSIYILFRNIIFIRR